MLLPRLSSTRFSFMRKLGAALALVLFAHWLFFAQELGATLGLFILAWCMTLFLAVPAMRRRGPAIALAIAALFGAGMIENPTLLGWILFSCAIATAPLLQRWRFDNAARWAVRLLSFTLAGLISPARDLLQILRLSSRGHTTVRQILSVVALPLLGGAAFLLLFACANPLIATALGSLSLPDIDTVLGHVFFVLFVATILWPTFRPRTPRFDRDMSWSGCRAIDLPVATVALSLAAFNGVFALQNGLDIFFLWSGAPLPDGVTLADYAHQGTYTLIVTALLAGAFILIVLAPSSRAAQSHVVRGLLLLWVAQNLLLVASSMLRLFDYIHAYLLTSLRLTALVWMGLVMVGLVLICWRLLTGRSAAWLINANAIAAGLVLAVSTLVDYGAISAQWNVTHAREARQLDLCHLNRLGSSALLPLITLEHHAAGPILRDRARFVRRSIQQKLELRQADWHQWTWRGARRLHRAETLVGADNAPLRPAPYGRACDGSINARSPIPVSPSAPAPRSDATQDIAPSSAPLTKGAAQ